ncbi:hypothetical protein [Mycolicibacterium fortuitum]|uniref:hypothetical protein n=1 Tax=Mycolicibacterium fortuitum TaxID=1766 RepID=UPI0014902B9F|nr:hypothetical protein [Mycolicibacterium fortuitum]
MLDLIFFLEIFTVPLGGEHFRRRPLSQVKSTGLTIEQSQGFTPGLVERLTVCKPNGAEVHQS